jgi:hypothetical protein
MASTALGLDESTGSRVMDVSQKDVELESANRRIPAISTESLRCPEVPSRPSRGWMKDQQRGGFGGGVFVGSSGSRPAPHWAGRVVVVAGATVAVA